MMKKTLFVLMAVITLGGCSSPNQEKEARETFSKKRSCPLDRVTSKPRPDLSAYDETWKGVQKTKPPADIADDPARVAMWEKDRAEKKKKTDASENVYEVNGCNETQLYACGVGRSNHGTLAAMCSPLK